MNVRHLQPGTPPSRTWLLSGAQSDLRQRFQALQSRQEVAGLLEVPYWQIDFHLRRSDPSERYVIFTLKKRSGGSRQIAAPCVGLKAIQHKLLRVLSAVYNPPKCVHGFTGQRSIITNAQVHAARRWVLNVDLQDFFPSITFPRVRGMFMAKPYALPPEPATMLAQICCTPSRTMVGTDGNPAHRVPGALPQGGPSSPIVANMICARMDAELVALAKNLRVTYTRYADDMTFSCRLRAFPSELGAKDGASGVTAVGEKLAAVVAANGFLVNPQKARLASWRGGQRVTGLTVNKVPNVRREHVREIRAMLHAWRKFGLEAAETQFLAKYNVKHRSPGTPSPSFRPVLRGKIEFLRRLRCEAVPLVRRLVSQYRELAGLPCIGEPNRMEALREALFILEACFDGEDGDAEIVTGTGFAVKNGDMRAVLTCNHVLTADSQAFRWNCASQKYPVEVLHKSEELDLALIKCPEEGRALEMGPNRLPAIHEKLMAIGFPNYNEGDSGYFLPVDIVSYRTWKGRRRCLVGASLLTGMSGGPVVDNKDRVGGVISHGRSSVSEGSYSEMHAFIPANEVHVFLDEARARGAF